MSCPCARSEITAEGKRITKLDQILLNGNNVALVHVPASLDLARARAYPRASLCAQPALSWRACPLACLSRVDAPPAPALTTCARYRVCSHQLVPGGSPEG